MPERRRSKLDILSLIFLVAGFTLFLIAAVCYVVSIIFVLTAPPGGIPLFSLGEIGNFAGIGGMLIIPLFVLTAVIVNFRENRREQKTGTDSDNATE